MPSIDRSFLLKLQDDFTKYPWFVETGTLTGGTTFALEPYFEKTITIEFSEKYHAETKAKYKGEKIEFLLGDSSIVFETLLPTLSKEAIFFLDGHWSGGDTGHSAKDCPLVEEVMLINLLFRPAAILIIDDFRLFGLDRTPGILGEDWSQINKDKLLHLLHGRVEKVYH